MERNANRLARFFRFDEFVYEDAVTSHWVSPVGLLAIRSILWLYTTITWVYVLVSTGMDGGFKTYFCFFTNLTFIGLWSYLTTATIHTIRYVSTGKSYQPISFEQQSHVLNDLYCVLYLTIVTYNLVTPVVYWSLLSSSWIAASPQPINWWSNLTVHGMSGVMMLIEVFFNRMRFYWWPQIAVPVLGMLLYMFEAWVTYATQHFWVYPFLDWSNRGWAALWYFIVLFIALLAFTIMYGLHRLRDYVAKRIHGERQLGETNEKGSPDAADEV